MRRLMVYSIPVLLSLWLIGCSSAPDTAATEPAAAPEEAVETTTPQEVAETGPADAEEAAEPETAPTAGAAVAAAPVQLQSDQDRTVYALGLVLSRNIADFSLSSREVEIVKRALSDSAVGKPAVELDEWGPKIDGLVQVRAKIAADARMAEGAKFMQAAATKQGAQRTESGIVYRMLTPGSGKNPASSNTVRVNYRGTLIDGTEFDSSYKRNEPAEFPLTGVIPCWTEGVQKIKVGGKAELICPSDLAYGPAARPSIPANSTLIFEIELLDIVN